MMDGVAPKLELSGIQDQLTRENFKTLQEMMGAMPIARGFRVVEFSVSADQERIKIKHGLGAIPLDVIPTRLIAPSGAKLTMLYSEFTKDELVVTVSGLSGTLTARLLVGSFPNVITSGTITRSDNETQEFKCKL